MQERSQSVETTSATADGSKRHLGGKIQKGSHKSQSANWFQLTPEDHMPPAGEQYFTPRQTHLQK